MKSFFNTILDGLTFKDIAGNRHPRIYAVLSSVILILLGILALSVNLERKTILDSLHNTPLPVEVRLEPTLTPEPTEILPESCPADSNDWTFLEVMPADNFKRVEPACVYESLGKSVAWALAVRSGYTRAEAAQVLGFTEFPMHRLNEVKTMTNTKGPLTLEVSFTPPHPDFAEWRVTDDGRQAMAYALRGCFRTYDIVGNQAQPWNRDYPVICALSEDSSGSRIVFQLDGHTFTSTAEPTRSFALFGYTGIGGWVWLGTQKEPKVGLKTIPDFMDDARVSAGLYGLPIWDAAWLGEKYGLRAKTLPKGWQSQTNESDRQAILDGLNKFIGQK